MEARPEHLLCRNSWQKVLGKAGRRRRKPAGLDAGSGAGTDGVVCARRTRRVHHSILV